MNVDKHDSKNGGDYEDAEDNNEDREAPSEQDIDKTNSKGKTAI